MLTAKRLTPGTVGRAEGDATLGAVGIMVEAQALLHEFWVILLKVFAPILAQSQILDPVVKPIVVDVVDDLGGGQRAAQVALHHKAVLKHVPAIVADDAIPAILPSLALAGAAQGGEALNLRGNLGRLAVCGQTLSSPAPEFREARAGTDGAQATGGVVRVPRTTQDGAADLARNVEGHSRLRVNVRQDTNTRITKPGANKTLDLFGGDR